MFDDIWWHSMTRRCLGTTRNEIMESWNHGTMDCWCFYVTVCFTLFVAMMDVWNGWLIWWLWCGVCVPIVRARLIVDVDRARWMIAFWLMTWWMCCGRRCGLTMVDYRWYVLIFVLMSVRCLLCICAKKERNDRSLTVDFVSVFRPSTPLMRCLCVMTVCVFDDIQWYSMIFNDIQWYSMIFEYI